MTANQIAVSAVIWAIMARMKAMTVNELGPPEVLRLQSYPDPVPVADQIHVRIHAIGLNFPEFLQIAGKYQHKPELPFVPGLEAAGDVIGIGPDVTRYAVGDKVVIHGKTGMYADQAVVSENAAIQLPTPFSYAEGAAFWAAYNTAYVCLVARGQLSAGDRVLIHGAAGGVGLAAVDVAHQVGAEVTAIVGSEDKAAAARALGADHVINHRDPDSAAKIEAIAGDNGFNLAYDPVGGYAFQQCLEHLAIGGRLLIVGFAGGTIPSTTLAVLRARRCAIIGVRAGEYGRQDPAAGKAALDALLDMAEAGRLSPQVYRSMPLADAAAGLRLLDSRQVIGKVVLNP